ncbi:hypothetical protein [Microbacterium sp. SORGH_AS_0888]|uniref:hypothetical protein n=1 Tax=Microbacterium sp. SORGH_AS_0888 TaxID=3041791 RepID=UPI0027854856|nr:hypothetical protein [Microbacterium sp. SORGH_AS_0888]MDQ1129163.1 hypothetical protein [Microbacterium sp. SORGH_AS_0888]
MSGWSYVPGPHPAILRENTLIAISGEGAEASARTLLATVTAATPLEDVIDVLIADGLGKAPDFFVGTLVDGSLTAFVRGSAVVTVEDDRWHRFYVNGQHARTWQELALDGVARIAVGFSAPTRIDLLSVPDEEREAQPGPLGVAEVVFRSPQPLAPLFTVVGPPVAAPRTAEFADAFPDDLFVPVDPELDGETRVTSLDPVATLPSTADEPALAPPLPAAALPPAPPVARSSRL